MRPSKGVHAVAILTIAMLALGILAVAPASAHIELALQIPPQPLALNGTKSIVLQLTIECSSVLLRGSHDPVPVAVNVTAPGLTFAGPATIDVPQPDCVTDETGEWTGIATFKVSGSRILPGLVPITVNATAHLAADSQADQLADMVDPVAPANTTGKLVPAAIVEYRVLPPGALPTAVGNTGLQIPVQLQSSSNVDLEIAMTAGTAPSAPTPQGTLKLPAPTFVLARATSIQHGGNASVTLNYIPPAAGAGTDRFALTLQPSVKLDSSVRVVATNIALSVPYEHPGGSSGSARAGAAGSVSSQTPKASPMPVMAASAVLLLALALVARRQK